MRIGAWNNRRLPDPGWAERAVGLLDGFTADRLMRHKEPGDAAARFRFRKVGHPLPRYRRGRGSIQTMGAV